MNIFPTDEKNKYYNILALLNNFIENFPILLRTDCYAYTNAGFLRNTLWEFISKLPNYYRNCI